MLELPCITDNQGNESLVVKNMTTKFPLYLILLELTEQIHANNWSLNLVWQNRDLNQDADNLTNGKFDDFSPSMRLDPPLDTLPWIIMPTLFEKARELHEAVTEHKMEAKSRRADLGERVGDGLNKKRKKRAGLKVTDPW